MKKRLAMIAVALALMLSVAGCDEGYETEEKSGKYIIISLPNGEVIEGEGEFVSWQSYGTVKVKIGDKIYHTHSENIIIIKEWKVGK